MHGRRPAATAPQHGAAERRSTAIAGSVTNGDLADRPSTGGLLRRWTCASKSRGFESWPLLWDGNHKSDVALAMHHRLQWLANFQSSVYVTVRCPSACLCNYSTTAAACATFTAVGPSAKKTIDRLMHGLRPASTAPQHEAAARRSTANASSVMLTADGRR